MKRRSFLGSMAGFFGLTYWFPKDIEPLEDCDCAMCRVLKGLQIIGEYQDISQTRKFVCHSIRAGNWPTYVVTPKVFSLDQCLCTRDILRLLDLGWSGNTPGRSSHKSAMDGHYYAWEPAKDSDKFCICSFCVLARTHPEQTWPEMACLECFYGLYNDVIPIHEGWIG